MNEPFDPLAFATLLERLLDAGAEEDWAQLNEILERSKEARHYYARYMQLRVMILQGGIGGAAATGPRKITSESTEMLKRDLSDTQIFPAAPKPNRVVKPAPPRDRFAPLPDRRLFGMRIPASFRAIAAGLFVVGGIGLAILYVMGTFSQSKARQGNSFATLVASSGASWKESSAAEEPRIGSRVPADHSYVLSKGVAEFSFDNGATAIIEGPAEFQLSEAKQVTLTRGRITVTAPHTAVGFTVKCPRGEIQDLGTHFGVEVSTGQPERIDVFKGKVQVSPAAESSGNSPPRMAPLSLVAGQRARIVGGTVELDPRGAVLQDYVQSVISGGRDLDVVDLLSGGDGTARPRRNIGIDANTGKWGKLPAAGEVASDHQYHRVPGLPAVDGCFVPGGMNTGDVVDSAGHRFAFPANLGRAYNRIWTYPGEWLPAQEHFVPEIGGVDYAQDPHTVLSIHSNQGITLDLDAIRHLHPGDALSGFKCTVANTYRTAPSKVDVFILVDGQPKFVRLGLTRSDGAIPVAFPLADSARFLTFVTTDSGKDIWGDWALYADAKLILQNR